MKWFNYEEFDSPDARLRQPYGTGFLEMLDEARTVAGIPFI